MDSKLDNASKPYEISKKLHEFYRGKIEVTPRCVIRDLNDFSYWYTPGVAQPCMEIHADPRNARKYTNRSNMVAVVSDGTRVLGLGNIGPLAGLPVMEGKALIFKYLGGVDAFPLVINVHSVREIVDFVKAVSPSFGGINLEDIETPKCFHVLDALRDELDIPVWHDDRQGTATIILAGVFSSLKLKNLKIEDAKFVLFGAGASNLAVADLLEVSGADPGNIVLLDKSGILNKNSIQDPDNPFKNKWSQISNKTQLSGGLDDALKGANFLIALSTPGPDIIKSHQIALMDKDPAVFACANPVPEIWPWVAKEAGAFITATGRSDFENQLNNSMVFPGMFRGALDCGARKITDDMCVTAAQAISGRAEELGLDPGHIVPTMEDDETHVRVAVAAAKHAMELGLAEFPNSLEYFEESARAHISHAKKTVKTLMQQEIIRKPPEI
ncbi:NADP-dependent malic enzyme [Myxococcota bacterium]|nr:NADP-dependent malic enzyme [Myxococcota bacterium]MBU1381168.1 NADP-dependent malic enzyme [Myxococcota bacterium]MBU1496740.1 NADP-dependent malic enzyme [Myxococcota bacterium]